MTPDYDSPEELARRLDLLRSRGKPRDRASNFLLGVKVVEVSVVYGLIAILSPLIVPVFLFFWTIGFIARKFQK